MAIWLNIIFSLHAFARVHNVTVESLFLAVSRMERQVQELRWFLSSTVGIAIVFLLIGHLRSREFKCCIFPTCNQFQPIAT